MRAGDLPIDVAAGGLASRLAAARLAVSEDGGVVAVEELLDQRRAARREDVELVRARPEHVLEGEGLVWSALPEERLRL